MSIVRRSVVVCNIYNDKSIDIVLSRRWHSVGRLAVIMVTSHEGGASSSALHLLRIDPSPLIHKKFKVFDNLNNILYYYNGIIDLVQFNNKDFYEQKR